MTTLTSLLPERYESVEELGSSTLIVRDRERDERLLLRVLPECKRRPPTGSRGAAGCCSRGDYGRISSGTAEELWVSGPPGAPATIAK